MLKISFATNIALHAMGLLASQQDGCCLTAAQLGGHLGVSENHLTKIMQRLTRVGLVASKRGPKGGFGLGRDKRDISDSRAAVHVTARDRALDTQDPGWYR